jgi:hypothetical protein
MGLEKITDCTKGTVLDKLVNQKMCSGKQWYIKLVPCNKNQLLAFTHILWIYTKFVELCLMCNKYTFQYKNIQKHQRQNYKVTLLYVSLYFKNHNSNYIMRLTPFLYGASSIASTSKSSAISGTKHETF